MIRTLEIRLKRGELLKGVLPDIGDGAFFNSRPLCRRQNQSGPGGRNSSAALAGQPYPVTPTREIGGSRRLRWTQKMPEGLVTLFVRSTGVHN